MIASLPRVVLSLEWLVAQLSRRGWLDAATARDLEIRAPEQRARLLRKKQDEGADPTAVSPCELVASFGLADPRGAALDAARLAQLIAEEAKLPYYAIDPLELDPQAVTQALSRPFALRHIVLPIKVAPGELTVAVEDPFDPTLDDELSRTVKGKVRYVVAAKSDILKTLTEMYGFRKSVESAAKESLQSAGISDFEQLVRLRSVSEIEANDQHVVNAVDFLLRYAFDQRASDIHIEPKRGDSLVRLRIDGVLHNVQSFPRQVHAALTSRLKTLARMDIAEKRKPQDGRIKTVFGDTSVELRVSTLPVAFGEKIVIRIFDPQELLRSLPDLGFAGQDLTTFQRWIERPHGLILVTGPTGSGKTTTLYTTLRTLAKDDVNVTSVEDPIEMVTEEFNQVAVQQKIGVDFAHALRTILRQDPDIIMVGEIRDRETAEMAIQAALTGHLVLSTLHTNDSVGAVSRLFDLEVPPFLVSSTLLGVLAQRLVRRVCKECKSPAPLTSDQGAALGVRDVAPYAGACIGVGCTSCRGTGYRGRVGVYEVLDVTPELAGAIARHIPEGELRAIAAAQGLRTLLTSALGRLAAGETSFEEVMRVVGDARGLT